MREIINGLIEFLNPLIGDPSVMISMNIIIILLVDHLRVIFNCVFKVLQFGEAIGSIVECSCLISVLLCQVKFFGVILNRFLKSF